MFYEFWQLNRRLVPVGQTTGITLKARYEQRQITGLQQQGKLTLHAVLNSGHTSTGDIAPWDGYEPVPFTACADDPDTICWQVTPQAEGEIFYQLRLETPAKTTTIAEWGLYALHDDLLPLIPLRGDLHIHTSCSECGNRNEDPRYVAAWACKRGLDFIAITDHMQLDPSLRTAEFIRTTDCPIQILPGEETHSLMAHQPTIFCRNRYMPANHIVSIGARAGVVEWANDHFEEYWSDMESRAAALPDRYPRNVRLAMAGSDWLIDKIHEFDGLAIFCHPFWRPMNRCNLPDAVREYILEQNKFDAIEVLGCGNASHNIADVECNYRGLAWWQQASLRRGSLIPLVSNTDSHRTSTLLGCQYTMVFADANTRSGVMEAIRGGRSLACLHYPDTPLSIYGDYRLVNYAYYLEREYFPEHDAHCAAAGEKLLASLQPPSPLHG